MIIWIHTEIGLSSLWQFNLKFIRPWLKHLIPIGICIRCFKCSLVYISYFIDHILPSKSHWWSTCHRLNTTNLNQHFKFKMRRLFLCRTNYYRWFVSFTCRITHLLIVILNKNISFQSPPDERISLCLWLPSKTATIIYCISESKAYLPLPSENCWRHIHHCHPWLMWLDNIGHYYKYGISYFIVYLSTFSLVSTVQKFLSRNKYLFWSKKYLPKASSMPSVGISY